MLKTDERTGLFYRDNSIDQWVIREQSGYQELFDNAKDQVVLDIGSNIGAFSQRVIAAGAKQTIGFEPEASNYKLLSRQNIPRSKFYNAAVAADDGEATFYVNKGRNKGLHSLQEVRGREHQIVKTISFEKILKKVKPDIIKVDIEGGEYALDFKLLERSCKMIAIEIHYEYGNLDNGKKLLKQLRKLFEEVSYKEVLHYGKLGTGLFIGRR